MTKQFWTTNTNVIQLKKNWMTESKVTCKSLYFLCMYLGFLTFPVGFKIQFIFPNFDSDCSNLLDLKTLQEQVKKHSVSKIVMTFHYLNKLL